MERPRAAIGIDRSGALVALTVSGPQRGMVSATLAPLATMIGTAVLVLAWVWPFAGGPTPATVPWLASVASLSVWLLVAVRDRPDVARCSALAWLIAALVSSVIGLLQFFGVSASFKPWINVTAIGDAFGNLRQRNQFATLTMMGLAVVVWGPWACRRPRLTPSAADSLAGTHLADEKTPAVWFGLLAAGVLAIGNATSSSRTGLLQLGLLVLLMLCWNKPAHPVAVMRLAVAIMAYAVATVALPLLAGLDPWNKGIVGRFGDADRACGSRILLWSNVLHLISLKPWLGWGWGELDHAHFVTLYPSGRFCDILDNAHNVPLHLAVELGVPVALLVCGVLGWLVLRARPWRETDGRRRMAWAVLALIGLHSLLEYPLWYGPFQIAVALAMWILWKTPVRWGPQDAGHPSVAAPRSVPRYVVACTSGTAIVLLCAVAYALWDYHRVSQIYIAPEKRTAAYRDDTLAKAQDSWLFRNQVRFAALTLTPVTPANAMEINRSAHGLLRFSPEARVVEKLIDSALVLGRTDEAVFFMRRFRIAYPNDYARWRETQEHGAELPALHP